MKKLALITAVSALSTPALAASTYSTMMLSGTAADPLAGMTNAFAAPFDSWYVDPGAGPASNALAPRGQLVRAATWTFDFTDPAAVSFTGKLSLGDYRVQSVIGPSNVADGRQSFTGVVQTFSGTGVYDAATRTFTYNFMNSAVNGGGASVYSATAPATCVNGHTNVIGKVCSAYATASSNWEGLALNFVFTEDRSSFSGTLRGMDTSGSELTRFTQTINWQVASVPVPASAWLFGSALLGLGTRRRRKH